MTTDLQTQTDPLAAIVADRRSLLRLPGVVAGAAGAVLPILSATAFGMTESSTLMQAAVLPVVAGLALLAPGIGPLRPYARLIDVLAVVTGVLLMVYVGYLYADAHSQIANMPGAGALGQTIAITPASGIAALAIATVLMAAAAFAGRKR
ncbi:hypothetical protein [Pelagibacterium halotolerans]|uniref:hypothetical protein n=1 Tax=Pelagibacterium halotolerans TaxID=531813 RepID=UPI00384E803F